MKSLATQIEEYRQRHGIKKTRMASLLGAPNYQRYYMWMRRDSIPKTHIDRARVLLQMNGIDASLNAEVIEKFSQLTPDRADTALKVIEGLLATPEDD